MEEKIKIKNILMTEKDIDPVQIEMPEEVVGVKKSELTAHGVDRIRSCDRCGHTWKIRAKTKDGEFIEPNICPNCKTLRWNEVDFYAKAEMVLRKTMEKIRENERIYKEASEGSMDIS